MWVKKRRPAEVWIYDLPLLELALHTSLPAQAAHSWSLGGLAAVQYTPQRLDPPKTDLRCGIAPRRWQWHITVHRPLSRILHVGMSFLTEAASTASSRRPQAAADLYPGTLLLSIVQTPDMYYSYASLLLLHSAYPNGYHEMVL